VAAALGISALWLGAGTAPAAPVDSVDTSAQAADPYELATRWTSQVLSTSSEALSATTAPAPAATVPRYTALPAAAQASGVPDPRAYALMGALLLGAGLVARRLSGAQRGFSKKT
jgi:hypothetical protein